MFVYVVVARWLYAEAELMIPRAMPLLNYALERTQIPTHDKWSDERFVEAIEALKNPDSEVIVGVRGDRVLPPARPQIASFRRTNTSYVYSRADRGFARF